MVGGAPSSLHRPPCRVWCVSRGLLRLLPLLQTSLLGDGITAGGQRLSATIRTTPSRSLSGESCAPTALGRWHQNVEGGNSFVLRLQNASAGNRSGSAVELDVGGCHDCSQYASVAGNLTETGVRLLSHFPSHLLRTN